MVALSRVISGIFHPYFLPLISFGIMLMVLPGTKLYPMQLKLVIMGIVMLTTVILPLIFILVYSMIKGTDMFLNKASDRLVPFLFTAICYFLGAQAFGQIPAVPSVFRTFLLASVVVIVVLTLVSSFWKISGHGACVGGLLGSVLAIVFRYGLELNYLIMGLIVVSGMVGASRIILRKHTPAQVYTGFSLGVLTLFLSVLFI